MVGSDDRVDLAAEQLLPVDRRSAQTLLPTMAEVLKACHWRPSELDLICVTSGPGSFTGLRIGVTAAKTLAFAVGAQITAVHTLAALAAGVPHCTGRLWAIMDAQRQELFAASFPEECDETTLEPVTRILSIDAWLLQLRAGDTVVGPPLAQLAQELPPEVTTVDAQLWQPQARVVGELGYKMFRQGHTTAPLQLVPNYYRKSAAEEKGAAKQI